MKIENNDFHKVRAYISNQKKSDDDIRRMFINRPLEPYMSFLMAWADFAPIFTDIEKEYKIILDGVLELLDDSLQLAKFAQKAIEEKGLHFRGINITDEDNLQALALTAREQIIHNYHQIFEVSCCSTEYEDIVNEYLHQITETILKKPVVGYKEPFKLHYGGLILMDYPYNEMLSCIESHKSGIRHIIKSLDYGYATEVLMLLHKQGATFNNRLFRDVYDFCDIYGYIPDELKQLHEVNTRPTAKSDYIRAAYNRLRTSGRIDDNTK